MVQNVLKQAINAIADGRLKTFIPLLSIFTAKGKPLTLDLHYQFAPLFNVIYPTQQVLMTGRQVGKTWQLAQAQCLRSAFIPFYDILHIEPRDEQRTRYHTTILKPLLQSSPISNKIISHAEAGKVLLKQFKSGSFMYLGTAYASAGALRGLSGCAQVVVDETTDIDFEFVPIIQEVMSANLRHGYTIYAGTPTTTDTTCGLMWARSSQAEWIIKCSHCGYHNIPNPEHDLLKMLGKEGIICAKCGKDIYPEQGCFVHAIPSLQREFPGYHISQTVHPLHLIKDPITGQHRKWYDLLKKINTYKKLQLYNEVFGWPFDQAINPLNLKDLIDAQNEYQFTDYRQVAQHLNKYRCLAIGVDWDGGGIQSESFTAACIIGLRRDSNVLDILYGKRWPKYSTPTEQAQEILGWVEYLSPDILAHDNTGAGFLRMEMLKQKGLMQTNTTPIPYNYTRPTSGDIIKLHHADRQADFYYYTLDKSRSLAVTLQAIKDASLTVPKFNPVDPKEVQLDFLALREDPRDLKGADPVVLITRKPGYPDDWAHAVNFACSAIWDRFKIYPVLGKRYDASALSSQYDQYQNLSPRSQFAQFIDGIHLHNGGY